MGAGAAPVVLICKVSTFQSFKVARLLVLNHSQVVSGQ
jgi:hypothetical protein